MYNIVIKYFYKIYSMLFPNERQKDMTLKDELPEVRSDQISCSVVSDSLGSHESQHARPPCPSPSPGVHSNSHPSSR